MYTSEQHANIVRHLTMCSRSLEPGVNADLTSISKGPYSHVQNMVARPAGGVARFASLCDMDVAVKTFDVSSFTGLMRSGYVDDMFNSLSGRLQANPAAFQHEYITPFILADIREVPGLGTTRAMVSRYHRWDISTYTRGCPRAVKFALVIEVAEALEYLHSHGVVHGNICPNNIFVTDQGTAALSDVLVNTLARQTLLPSSRNTSRGPSSIYQPPEALQPGFVHPTTSSDVYALAVVVFMVFTENLPFYDLGIYRTDDAIVEILKRGHLRIKRPADPVFSDSFWGLLQWCLTREPGARPTIGEFVDAMQYIELYPEDEL